CHGFAEIGMRDTENSALKHALDRVDLGLDLLRIHVEAARNHEVLGPPDDVDVALVVNTGQVAGDEIPVSAKLLHGLLAHPPIASEDVGPLDLDDADLARLSQRAALEGGDAHTHSRKRKTHCPRTAFAVVRVRRDHIGFGHAVALENGEAGPLPPGGMSLGEQGRGPRDEETHFLTDIAIETGMVEQTSIE